MRILNRALDAAAECETPARSAAVQSQWRRSFVAAGLLASVVFAVLFALHVQKTPLKTDEIIRADESGRVLTLADRSIVEMRSNSELRLESSSDGMRIHLIEGDVIVSAAKQVEGHHLYVLTKDATVSVVGTVFLVRSETEGSRIAVLEGQVRVQQGATTTTLLPGHQLATNPNMEPRTVKEELSWSRQAVEHTALSNKHLPV